MQFKTVGKIYDKKILAKAEQLLVDLANGIHVCVRKLKVTSNLRGDNCLKSIVVSRSYRLLLRSGKWLLMTHERYSKEIER